MAILGIVQLLKSLYEGYEGIKGLQESNKIPKELQALYDQLLQQSKTGLGGERATMLSSGASALARQATGAQARGSMALASRSVGSSSSADSMLGNISTAHAQGYSDLLADINRIDQEIKRSATSQLSGVVGAIDATRKGQQVAAGQLLGNAATTLTDRQFWKDLGIGGMESTAEKQRGEYIKTLEDKVDKETERANSALTPPAVGDNVTPTAPTVGGDMSLPEGYENWGEAEWSTYFNSEAYMNLPEEDQNKIFAIYAEAMRAGGN